MHALDHTLFHSNIGLRPEIILFSQSILAGLVDSMIHLRCPNLDHDLSYLGALACPDP